MGIGPGLYIEKCYRMEIYWSYLVALNPRDLQIFKLFEFFSENVCSISKGDKELLSVFKW
jgi:hypothetical protein